MRILHVVNRVNTTGDGIANVCIDLACEQADRGDQVGLACEYGGFVPLAEKHGVRHFPAQLTDRSLAGIWTGIRGLRRAVRAFSPDVVHAHTLTGCVFARIAMVGRRTPVIATVHNEYQRGVLLTAMATFVVAVSEAVSASMHRRHVPRWRLRTVFNGVVGSARKAHNTSLERRPLPDGALLFVGSICARKGTDLLVDAFAQLGDEHAGSHLFLVGNVDWPAVAEAAEASAVSERIHFVGFDAHPEQYMAAASVFVLPSRHDPFPLVLLEAMSMGMPIVATRVDGIPEALDNGTAGLLVEPDDAGALSRAMSSLLDSSELREQYSTRARAQSDKFSVRRMTDDYSRVYGAAVATRWYRNLLPFGSFRAA